MLAKRRVTAYALGALLALGFLAGLTPVKGLVIQYRYPTYQACTVEHFTKGDHAVSGKLAYAYSDIFDYNGRATWIEVKAEWCKNYYCENTGYVGTYQDFIGLRGEANVLVPTLDLVRGWSLHCVDYPPFLCSSVDFSGDLPP